MKNKTHFDYIFSGAGLAGLTLAVEMSKRAIFRGKKIALIDASEKKENDRTWCSWATESEDLTLFQTGVKPFKSWSSIDFFGEKSARIDISPYQYHVVRGIDFYENARKILAQNVDIQWITTEIQSIDFEKNEVKTAAGSFTADQIFNSFFDWKNLKYAPDSTNLLQHFKGILIETDAPIFDEKAMTFMDFRIEQANETRFIYVLPVSKNRALVEFTIFGKALLAAEIYDQELDKYLRNQLKINDLRIVESEFGVIPMTDFRFQNFTKTKKSTVIQLGTTAGFVKASSGYAFKRTQEKVKDLLDFYEKTGRWDAEKMASKWIFRAFDAIFLEVFRSGRSGGKAVFSSLFEKKPAPLVFKFLDEKTGFFETIPILLSCPIWPFFRSLLAIFPRIFRV